jgi:hypothetical protein
MEHFKPQSKAAEAMIRQHFDDWEKVSAAFWQISSEKNPGFQETLAKQLQEMHEASVAQVLAAEPETSFDCPPVLFCVFNRPETTQKVLTAISKARPKRLYVAADGPRADKPGEAELCGAVRQIACAVDWPCEVSTLFQPQNQGCAVAVATALTWFFGHEEQGIILEDDTVPSLDFFHFCAENLERFKNDEAVGAISGNQFYDGPFAKLFQEDKPYALGSTFHLWGWASWRRVWKHFQLDVRKLNKALVFAELEARFAENPKRKESWLKIWSNTENYLIDTWDYAFVFSMLAQKQFVLEPRVNLVENIGAEGTHYSGSNAALLFLPPILPLK